jgi:hypothetical protein
MLVNAPHASRLRPACLMLARLLPTVGVLSAKYEFTSSNTTRPTFAFDACFVWKIAPLADERNGFFIENPSRRWTRSSTY